MKIYNESIVFKKREIGVQKFGRNPKCDRDWIKVQRKKGNRSPKRKGKIKVQIEKGK